MRNRRIGQYAMLASLLLGVLIISGCDKKTINEIKADPSRYHNKDVGVVGTVTKSVSVAGRGFYEVDDGTGRLWVMSERGVPREGARVGVKGEIKDAYNVGSLITLPDPVSSGLVMIESSHKAR